MNAYAALTTKSLSREYRAAYTAHQALSAEYAEGRATSADLRASADNLKAIRLAFRAESEANQVRRR